MLDTAEADALLVTAVMSDEGSQDPYPVYARMREEVGQWPSGLGPVVLTRYDESLEALRNPRLGRTESDMEPVGSISGRQGSADRESSVMLFLNPPDHTRIRGLVSRAFTPRRVETLRPRLVELLEPGLDNLAAGGGGDVMSELAVPFPVAVISELLGVPRDESEELAPLVHDGTRLIDAAATDEDMARGEAATEKMASYFVELAERKRSDPDDGLFSALIGLEAEGDRLSEQELISNTILLYAAGFETTSNLIGNGLRLLLANPEQTQRLRDDRSLMPSAIWEILRHDSPVQLNVRAVLEDVDLLGSRRSRGEHFLILQGSANHDPRVYTDPGSFDVGRFAAADGTVPTPLSFGWGAHHCLGAHLARAEGEILFGALLDRFELMELDTDALEAAGNTTGRPRFSPSFTLRGLESLPVRVTAA